MSALPPTFVPGFHNEATVRKLKFSKLGKTDMVVSNCGVGGASFGTEMEPKFSFRLSFLKRLCYRGCLWHDEPVPDE